MKKNRLQVTLLLFIVIVVTIFLLIIKPNLYRFTQGKVGFETLYVFKQDAMVKESLVVADKNIFLATVEGIERRSESGKRLWSKSFHFNELLLTSKGKYVAAVDLTGKEAYIFDADGMIAQIVVSNEIVYATLSESGHLALILDSGKEQYIEIYNKDGDKNVERKTVFEEHGYPVFIELSDNGEKGITCHLNTNNNKVESIITFLDFSKSGKTLKDRVLGHRVFEDVLISRAYFLENEKVAFAGKNGIKFVNFDENLSEVASVNFSCEALQIKKDGKNLFVNYGEASSYEEQGKQFYVGKYDQSGQLISEVSTENDAKISVSDGTTYLINGNEISAYKGDKLVWESSVSKEIEDVKHLYKDVYLIEYQNNYELLRLKSI